MFYSHWEYERLNRPRAVPPSFLVSSSQPWWPPASACRPSTWSTATARAGAPTSARSCWTRRWRTAWRWRTRRSSSRWRSPPSAAEGEKTHNASRRLGWRDLSVSFLFPPTAILKSCSSYVNFKMCSWCKLWTQHVATRRKWRLHNVLYIDGQMIRGKPPICPLLSL